MKKKNDRGGRKRKRRTRRRKTRGIPFFFHRHLPVVHTSLEKEQASFPFLFALITVSLH